MKFNLFALITILSCTTNAVVSASCTESSGVCVCSGTCPSFTANWSTVIDGGSTCFATTSAGSTSLSNGVVTIDGQTYSSEESCGSAVADGASGDASASGGDGGSWGGGGGGNGGGGGAVVGGVAAAL
eukprot:scaffold3345_cov83-Skeletonema_dohrnii-CCMP3373.AAC.1